MKKQPKKEHEVQHNNQITEYKNSLKADLKVMF